MSLSFTLRDTQSFPPGTVVKAFQAQGSGHPFPGHRPPERGTAPPPAAPVIAEGTMGNETLTLSGLEAGTDYLAAGLSGGVWRWVGFRTPNEAEAPAGGLTQATADARYLPLTETVDVKTVSSNVTLSDATMSVVTMSGAATLAAPAAVAGHSRLIEIVAGATHAWTISGVTWDEGIVPTPSAVDLVALVCLDGTHWRAKAVGQAFA